jgi:ribosomal protein L5
MATTNTARLLDAYNSSYRKELQKELNISNINDVPKLEKIVIFSFA